MSTRYMNGLEYMKTTPGVMERLFELIYSSSVNVSRQATALVFIVCQFLEDGTVEYVEHGLECSTSRAFGSTA